MAFDWLTFFDRYGVEYQPARRGWLDCWCPWCGGPGTHHLGVSLESGGYHCWHGHNGISPHRLVAALLNCTRAEADRIVGSSDVPVSSDEDFATDSFRRLGLVLETRPAAVGDLRLLPEFPPIRDSGPSGRLALPYLKGRGYDKDSALKLADRYGLTFATSGPFAYRVVVPVVEGGKLVNWTGRSVARSEALRYKSLSADPERAAAQGLPIAARNIKDLLFDLDEVRRGGEVLALTEGPFDAMRVGFLGERFGVRATCLFGKRPTPAQVDLLDEVRGLYDKVVALMDRDARWDSFLFLPDDWRVDALQLPEGIKDPAELTERQFRELFDR
jgi:hypothetical protein